jgi:hypothetical protein
MQDEMIGSMPNSGGCALRAAAIFLFCRRTLKP